MNTDTFEKIESYLGLLEELKLQRIELETAKSSAIYLKNRLNDALANTSRDDRKLYLRKHLDFLIEGIAILERGLNTSSNNIEVYEQKFDHFLKGVQP